MGLDLCEALFSVGENSYHLFKLYAWKPFEKVVNRSARFQIFKQGAYGHAAVTKTQAPLTFPSIRSTSLHASQSSILNMICFGIVSGKSKSQTEYRAYNAKGRS